MKSAIAIAAIAIIGIGVAFVLTFEENAAEKQREIEVLTEIPQPTSEDGFIDLTLVRDEKPEQNSAPSVPLDEAIASFNEKALQRLADLPADQRPAPLTMDRVVQAINDWKPKELDVNTQRIFRRIAETRQLPRGAKNERAPVWLESHLQWWGGNWNDAEKYGENEVFKWRVMLSAMISETTGYSLLIQEENLDRRRALRPAAGYAWQVHPYSPLSVQSGGHSAGGVVFSIDRAEDDALTVTASWVPAWAARRKGEQVHGLRFVAFDEQGRRYLLKETGIGAHNELRMSRFGLDPKALSASDVRHLGIEAMDNAGLEIASSAAVSRARERGIDVLGLPKIGQRYGFTLTTADVRAVESKELEGKVVLIDCWASWCGPCMEKLPEMKDIYNKWHAKGLEVIGVSFDDRLSDAEAAYKQHLIQWPLVIVPGDDDVRKLWDEASRITSIPRVLLIDRQGILRHDLSSPPWDVDAKVAALIDQSSMQN